MAVYHAFLKAHEAVSCYSMPSEHKSTFAFNVSVYVKCKMSTVHTADAVDHKTHGNKQPSWNKAAAMVIHMLTYGAGIH